MININSVTLVGRLTKDIELRKTSSNTSVCNFTVAVDRRFQSQQQNGQSADFISCIAWRQSADFLAQYASKGTIVGVEGRIQTRSYDGQNGKVYVTEVVADSVQIISNRNGANASANSSYSAPVTNNQTFTPSVEPGYDSMDDDFSNTPSLDISSDDLPFY
ncbi:MAG: single-stranded DNA-binding protein [Erysipelotrichaceae bacterium]|nr:single-stranded DNA-binding protein [Erysipelotrichaceae bacterium]